MVRFQRPGYLCLPALLAAAQVAAQYTGYSLTREGSPEYAVYETADTPSNATNNTVPDVYLNASVHVGGIYLDVENITAKINLDLQVKKLLSVNAGVTASIDRVRLAITDVNARVKLEARLANLVLMVNDVLHSIDLNPIIATLGNDLGKVVNTTVGGLTGNAKGKGKLTQRSYRMEKNILYSVNDYSGKTHTNRVLKQNGDIVDQFLDNSGVVHDEKKVGYYETDMTFNGRNVSMAWDGEAAWELEYVYNPFVGISVVSAIFVNGQGKVVGTQMVSESGGGGTSTIGND